MRTLLNSSYLYKYKAMHSLEESYGNIPSDFHVSCLRMSMTLRLVRISLLFTLYTNCTSVIKIPPIFFWFWEISHAFLLIGMYTKYSCLIICSIIKVKNLTPQDKTGYRSGDTSPRYMIANITTFHHKEACSFHKLSFYTH